MFSITRRAAPRPKLRVTRRTAIPEPPQDGHRDESLRIDSDDEREPGDDGFDDDTRRGVRESVTSDDVFVFERMAVTLCFDEFSREDDAFEVEDRKVVIVQLLGGMRRDQVLAVSDQVAKTAQSSGRNARCILLPGPGT